MHLLLSPLSLWVYSKEHLRHVKAKDHLGSTSNCTVKDLRAILTGCQIRDWMDFIIGVWHIFNTFSWPKGDNGVVFTLSLNNCDFFCCWSKLRMVKFLQSRKIFLYDELFWEHASLYYYCLNVEININLLRISAWLWSSSVELLFYTGEVRRSLFKALCLCMYMNTNCT